MGAKRSCCRDHLLTYEVRVRARVRARVRVRVRVRFRVLWFSDPKEDAVGMQQHTRLGSGYTRLALGLINVSVKARFKVRVDVRVRIRVKVRVKVMVTFDVATAPRTAKTRAVVHTQKRQR